MLEIRQCALSPQSNVLKPTDVSYWIDTMCLSYVLSGCIGNLMLFVQSAMKSLQKRRLRAMSLSSQIQKKHYITVPAKTQNQLVALQLTDEIPGKLTFLLLNWWICIDFSSFRFRYVWNPLSDSMIASVRKRRKDVERKMAHDSEVSVNRQNQLVLQLVDETSGNYYSVLLINIVIIFIKLVYTDNSFISLWNVWLSDCTVKRRSASIEKQTEHEHFHNSVLLSRNNPQHFQEISVNNLNHYAVLFAYYGSWILFCY